MAKKDQKVVENVEIVEPDTTEETSEKKSKKTAKDNKQQDKKKSKKKEKKGGLGKKIKESFSEIKKVNWPTFGKVCKQTGMVLAVVAVCTLLLFGMDRLLGWLFTLFAY